MGRTLPEISYVSRTVINSLHGQSKISDILSEQQTVRVDVYEKICLVTEQNIKLSKVYRQSLVCFVFKHKCISNKCNFTVKPSNSTEEKSAFIIICFLLGLSSWISYFH